MVVSLRTKQITIKHEHSHLYECSIGALLLQQQNDLILFSKDGMIVLNLGMMGETKRAIKDSQDVDYYLHTLSSCKDLRLEESNHLKFSRKEQDGLYEISVQEQFRDDTGETCFQEVYKIKIDEMSLREVLIFQSICNC